MQQEEARQRQRQELARYKPQAQPGSQIQAHDTARNDPSAAPVESGSAPSTNRPSRSRLPDTAGNAAYTFAAPGHSASHVLPRQQPPLAGGNSTTRVDPRNTFPQTGLGPARVEDTKSAIAREASVVGQGNQSSASRSNFVQRQIHIHTSNAQTRSTTPAWISPHNGGSYASYDSFGHQGQHPPSQNTAHKPPRGPPPHSGVNTDAHHRGGSHPANFNSSRGTHTGLRGKNRPPAAPFQPPTKSLWLSEASSASAPSSGASSLSIAGSLSRRVETGPAPSVRPPAESHTAESETNRARAHAGGEGDGSDDIEFMPLPVRITPSDPSLRSGASTSGTNGSTSHFQGSRHQNSMTGGPSHRNRKQTTSYRTAGGGGRTNANFNDDEGEEESRTMVHSSRVKGKGKPQPQALFTNAMSQATSATNKAKSGKGSHSSISNTSSWSPMQAGSSNSTPRQRKRVIRQDDSLTSEEQAVLLLQSQLAAQGEQNRQYRVGDSCETSAPSSAPAHALKVRGAAKEANGKGKAPETITLDSDAEESDPIQESDERPRNAFASGLKATLGQTSSAPSRNPIRRHPQHPMLASPSSEMDELGMDLAPNLQRKSGGNVKTIVKDYEAKTKIATSLEPRNAKKPLNPPPPPLDGSGSGEDGMDELKFGDPSNAKRPSKARKKATSARETSFEPVIDLSIEPYMLAKTAVAYHNEDESFSLKLNTAGNVFQRQTITIVKTGKGGRLTEVADFKPSDIQTIDWMSVTESSELSDALAFTFKSKQGPRIMATLGDGLISSEELAVLGAKNELFVMSKGQKLGNEREDEPSTAFGKILYCLKRWPEDNADFVDASKRRAAFADLYNHAAPESKVPKNSAASSIKLLPSSKVKDKNGSVQSTLSFSGQNQAIPGNNFYSHPSSSRPSARSEQEGISSGVEILARAPQPRRSGRQSNSIYKQPESRIPPVKDPYPLDHVVLEYPIRPIGSIPAPGSVTVTYGDKKRLNDDEFLNDTLIEFGLKKAIDDVKKADEARSEEDKVAPMTHVFNSFFYKKLSSGKQTAEDKQKEHFTPYYLVQKWTKKFNFFDRKYVVVPINEHLHWYLAVIVNPKWIIDAAPKFPPPRDGGKGKAPATRGRTSTAGTQDLGAVTLDSSSQTEIASREPGITGTPPRVSKYFTLQTEEAQELRHDQQEAAIQEKIETVTAKTEMGGPEGIQGDSDDDTDVNMIDGTAEGGGNDRPAAGTNAEDAIVLSDDDGEQQGAQGTSSSTHHQQSATSHPDVAQQARVAVPIGVPTAPPKGASSPAPADDAMEIDGDDDEQRSAVDIARELGSDPSLSEKCWIFTFDSLGAKHEAVVEKLKKYLDMEAKTKLNREWTAINEVRGIAVKVPKQPNFCDCGLYVLHFVEKFLADPLAMTRYIVSTETNLTGIKGNGEAQKRERAERRAKEAQLNAAIDREDRWSAQEAQNKRWTMRAEVERLMEEYAPIKVAKDAKEAEEKLAREKKREERDREKEKRTNDTSALESATAAQMERKRSGEKPEREMQPVGETQGTATRRRASTRGKKQAEVLDLSETTDEEDASDAETPRKNQQTSSEQIEQRAHIPVPGATVAESRRPTNADFLPRDDVTPAQLSTRPEAAQTLPATSPLLGFDTLAEAQDLAAARGDENGDLDNTQEADTEPSAPRSRTTPSGSPPPRSHSGRPHRDASSDSRPLKRRKTVRVPPKRPSSHRSRDNEEEEEDREVGDSRESSIEFQQASPELFENPPPGNQEQLAPRDSSSTPRKKQHARTQSVVDSQGSPRLQSPRNGRKTEDPETIEVD